jgi:hypothetical protein
MMRAFSIMNGEEIMNRRIASLQTINMRFLKYVCPLAGSLFVLPVLGQNHTNPR